MRKLSHHINKHIHDNRPFILGSIGLAAVVVLFSNVFVSNQNVTYQSQAQEVAAIPWQFNYTDLWPGERESNVNYAAPTVPIPTRKPPLLLNTKTPTPFPRSSPTPLLPTTGEGIRNTPTLAPTTGAGSAYDQVTPTKKPTPTWQTLPNVPPAQCNTGCDQCQNGQRTCRAVQNNQCKEFVEICNAGIGQPGGGGSSGGGNNPAPTRPPVCPAPVIPAALRAECVNNGQTIRFTAIASDAKTIISVNKWENDEGAVDFEKEFDTTPGQSVSLDVDIANPNDLYTYWSASKNNCGIHKGYTYDNRAGGIRCGSQVASAAGGAFSIVKTNSHLDAMCNGVLSSYVGSPISGKIQGSAQPPDLLEKADVYVGRADGSRWNSCPKGTTPANANNLWCLIKTFTFINPQNDSAEFTFTPDTPGEFNIVINGKTQGNARTCSGNPTCTFNGGSVSCDASSWYDCGANDSIKVVAKQFDGSCSAFTALPNAVAQNDIVAFSWKGLPVAAAQGGRYQIRVFNSISQKYLDKLAESGFDLSFSDYEPTGTRILKMISTLVDPGTYEAHIFAEAVISLSSKPIKKSNSFIVNGPKGATEFFLLGTNSTTPLIVPEGGNFEFVIRNMRLNSDVSYQHTDINPRPRPISLSFPFPDSCTTATGCRMKATANAAMPVGSYELQLYDENYALVKAVSYVVKKTSLQCPKVSLSCPTIAHGGNTDVHITNRSFLVDNTLNYIRVEPDGALIDDQTNPPNINITNTSKVSLKLINTGSLHLYPPTLQMNDCLPFEVPLECRTIPTPTPTLVPPPGGGGTLSVSPLKVVHNPTIGETVEVLWQGIPGVNITDYIELYPYQDTTLTKPLQYYVVGVRSSLTFSIPSSVKPGRYEMRYYNSSLSLAGRKLLAQSGPFEIMPASSSVTPTATPTPEPAYIQVNPTTISLPAIGTSTQTVKVTWGSPVKAQMISLVGAYANQPNYTYAEMLVPPIDPAKLDSGATAGSLNFKFFPTNANAYTTGTYKLQLYADTLDQKLLATTTLKINVVQPTQILTNTPTPTLTPHPNNGVIIGIGATKSFDFHSQYSTMTVTVGYPPSPVNGYRWRFYNEQGSEVGTSQGLAAVKSGYAFTEQILQMPVNQPQGIYQVRLVDSSGAVLKLYPGAYVYGYNLPDGSRPIDARLVFKIVAAPTKVPTATPTTKPTPTFGPPIFGFVPPSITAADGTLQFPLTNLPFPFESHTLQLYSATKNTVYQDIGICFVKTIPLSDGTTYDDTEKLYLSNKIWTDCTCAGSQCDYEVRNYIEPDTYELRLVNKSSGTVVLKKSIVSYP